MISKKAFLIEIFPAMGRTGKSESPSKNSDAQERPVTEELLLSKYMVV
jgi:hypothetical protein